MIGIKPARIEARIRNNILYHCIFDNYDNVAKFCRECGFHGSEVGGLLNLTFKPKNIKSGEYRQICVKLAKFFKALPEDLFPEYLYYDLEKNKTVIELSYAQLPDIDRNKLITEETPEDLFIIKENATRLNSVLNTLSPREREVVKMRFGIEGEVLCLEQIAKSIGVCRERVRQIEAKAIRKMRHPKRARLYI